jgi:hypothetical protein
LYSCILKHAINFIYDIFAPVPEWSFLTNHGRVLQCIARNPNARLRDIAAELSITERRIHGIVSDLIEAGFLLKAKDGRRNRYQVQDHAPLPDRTRQERAIGDLLDLLEGPSRP